jgi:AraC-like DNA-binding protein
MLDPEIRRRLERSREFIAARYQDRVTLEIASKTAHLSPFHFHRLFREAYGETPHDFLTRRRIDAAKDLLVRGELPVTEVCLEVGYESLGSFSSRFRQLVGRAPSEYRRAARPLFQIRFVEAPFCLVWMRSPWPS